MSLIERFSEKIAKKLIGRAEMEDALKRLDKLTQEEARMAAAQNLKATHTVDERVKGVADTVEAIENKVADIDDQVDVVNDRVASVNEKVVTIDDKVKGIAGDVDEMRRSSSKLTLLTMLSYSSCQATNYGKALTNGSPHLTPRPTTISHVVLITRKLQHGFFKAGFIRSGRQLARFFGFMENVCPFLFPSQLPLIPSRFVAGSGKSVIWFVGDKFLLSEVIDAFCQFHSHPRSKR